MREKVMLISGCSHTSGSEIDGTADSVFNRQRSYGNLLADKMGYRPINIALNGNSNGGILRNTIEWITTEYDPQKIDLFVLVGWTEPYRIDFPLSEGDRNGPASFPDWKSKTTDNFFQANVFGNSNDRQKQRLIKYVKPFLIECPAYFEIYTLNLMLHLQHFLRYYRIKYLMVNTMHSIQPEFQKFSKVYVDQIDNNYFYKFGYEHSYPGFYWHYKDLGYHNKQSIFDHHDEKPHQLFANELYQFINGENNE